MNAQPDFTAHDLTVLAICDRKGWTISDWLDLPEWEQLEWQAHEHWRKEALRNLLTKIQYDETKVDDSGKEITKHYVHDYGSYIDILRELSGC